MDQTMPCWSLLQSVLPVSPRIEGHQCHTLQTLASIVTCSLPHTALQSVMLFVRKKYAPGCMQMARLPCPHLLYMVIAYFHRAHLGP